MPLSQAIVDFHLFYDWTVDTNMITGAFVPIMFFHWGVRAGWFCANLNSGNVQFTVVLIGWFHAAPVITINLNHNIIRAITTRINVHRLLLTVYENLSVQFLGRCRQSVINLISVSLRTQRFCMLIILPSAFLYWLSKEKQTTHLMHFIQ